MPAMRTGEQCLNWSTAYLRFGTAVPKIRPYLGGDADDQ